MNLLYRALDLAVKVLLVMALVVMIMLAAFAIHIGDGKLTLVMLAMLALWILIFTGEWKDE